VFDDVVVIVADISIRFKYSYGSDEWWKEWEIGGVGFTYEPVSHWEVSLKYEDIKKAYSLCTEYFRVLHESKDSGLYWQIVLQLEDIDIEYSEKKMVVGVYFDISCGEGKYKCNISKTSESVLLVEVVGSEVFGSSNVLGKRFEIDKMERENKEVAVEILGRLFEDEIKKEVTSRVRIGKQPRLYLLDIEEKAESWSETLINEWDDQDDYSSLFDDVVVIVADVRIRFKYSYDGEYWRREWVVGGIGFTCEPVREWVVLLDNGDTKKVHSLCTECFRVLHESKDSGLYWQIVSQLENIDEKYRRKKREVSVDFDISYGKRKYKCKISNTYESVLSVEVVDSEVFGSSHVFEIYLGGESSIDRKRKNKEIATEIIGRIFEDEIKKEIQVE
jgi:hypothetical protein